MNFEAVKTHHFISKLPISSLRVFGSFCRTDWNENSDIDILCVSNLTREENEILEKTLKGLIGAAVSVSFYKEERVKLMFSNGHLFAWHLYQESIPLIEESDFITTLKIPNCYTESENDIRHFIQILTDVSTTLYQSSASIIFEAGIIYLCLRNIALSASWHLNTNPDFSKFSPFNLNIPSNMKINLPFELYKELMLCRHASTRGVHALLENKEDLISASQEGIRWATSLLELISKGNKNAD